MYFFKYLTLPYLTFWDNSAQEVGGAVQLTTVDKTDYVTCYYDKNKGDTGGTVYVYNSGVVTNSKCSFTSNIATQAGGAVYNEKCRTVSYWFCNFNNNGGENNQNGRAIVAIDYHLMENMLLRWR